MQTKLLIASLAALGDIARAESDAVREVARADTLSFIAELAHCHVTVENLVFNFAQKTVGGAVLLENYLEFDLENTENCPGMVVEAWIETPQDKTDDAELHRKFSADETKTILDKVQNAAPTFSYVKDTKQGGGDYYAHIKVWSENHPESEWTMPLVAHCAYQPVEIICPTFSKLEQNVTQAVATPSSVKQLINFKADDAAYLDLCELEATISVGNDCTDGWTKKTMSREELQKFVKTGNAAALEHTNDYGVKKCVTVEFLNVKTPEILIPMMTTCTDDATPKCEVVSSTKIDSCTVDPIAKTLTAKGSVLVKTMTPACGAYHMPVNNTVTSKGQTESKLQTLNDMVVDVSQAVEFSESDVKIDYQFLPIQINAQSLFSSERPGDITGSSASIKYTCETPCAFEASKISLKDDKTITDGITIDAELTIVANFSDFCNGFDGLVQIYHGKELVDSKVVPEKTLGCFYRNDDGEQVIKVPVSHAFVTGDFTYKFTMTNKIDQENKQVSVQYTEVGKPCLFESYVDYEKADSVADATTGKKPVLSLVDQDKNLIHLNANLKVGQDLVAKAPIDQVYCDVDLMSVSVRSTNFGTVLTAKDGTSMDIYYPTKKNNQSTTDVYVEADKNAKVNFFKNGYYHTSQLDMQDVYWYLHLDVVHDCGDNNEDCLTTYFDKKTPSSVTSTAEYTYEYYVSCMPKIESLAFNYDKTSEGDALARATIVYELGGALRSCGCLTNAEKQENEVSPDIAVTYDIIRNGNTFTDINFDSVVLTKEQILNAIRSDDKSWIAPSLAVEFPGEDGDYFVQMTFAELRSCGGSVASASSNSDKVSIRNSCTVEITEFSYEIACSATNEEIVHTFTAGYNTSRWCEFETAQIAIKGNNEVLKLAKENVTVPITKLFKQKSELSLKDYEATLTVTSNKQYAEAVTKTCDLTRSVENKADCECKIGSAAESHAVKLQTETLTSYTMNQYVSWTTGAFCFDDELTLTMKYADLPSREAPILKGSSSSRSENWTVLEANTQTGKATYEFCSNTACYDQGTLDFSWEKPCIVDVTDSTIVGHTYEDKTQAKMSLNLKLDFTTKGMCSATKENVDLIKNVMLYKILDCAHPTDCDKQLWEATPTPISIAGIKYVEGTNELIFNQPQPEDGNACYGVEYTVTAVSGKLDTLSVPSDKMYSNVHCVYPEDCTPTINTFVLSEDVVENAAGDVIPKFHIELSLDRPRSVYCKPQSVVVALAGAAEKNIKVDLTDAQIESALSTGGLTFDAPKLPISLDSYKASAQFSAGSGLDKAADITFTPTIFCHLSIDEFVAKDPKILDQDAKLDIEIFTRLSAKPEVACKEQNAVMKLNDKKTGDELFSFKLSPDDIRLASLEAGLELNARVEYVKGQEINGTLNYNEITHTHADENQTKTTVVPMLAGPADYCDVVVETFCLKGLSTQNGEEMFEFEIKVDKSSACGALQIGLDVIHDDKYTSIPAISVDQSVIDASAACDCAKTIYVCTSGFEGGVVGDFYGQVDIREAASGLIIVQDSSHFTF